MKHNLRTTKEQKAEGRQHLLEAWNDYRRKYIPDFAHREQVDFCKACFYAGGISVFQSLMIQETDDQQNDIDAAIGRADDVKNELLRYLRQEKTN